MGKNTEELLEFFSKKDEKDVKNVIITDRIRRRFENIGIDASSLPSDVVPHIVWHEFMNGLKQPKSINGFFLADSCDRCGSSTYVGEPCTLCGFDRSKFDRLNR